MKRQVKRSIRIHLLLSLLGPLLLLWAVSSAVAYYLAVDMANDAYDRELLNSADSVAARLRANGAEIFVDLPPAAQEILRHNNKDRFFYQVLRSDGTRISGDFALPGPVPNTLTVKPAFRYAKLARSDMRVARICVDVPGYLGRTVFVQVAETLNSRHHLAQQILLSIMLPQIILVLLGAIVVSRGVATGLAPLLVLAQDIGERSQSDLTPVPEANVPIEVRPLMSAINDLLQRLRSDIESQKRFVANAAHQFRTPLAALKTYIYCAKRLPSDREMNSVLDKIDESTERMSHLSNKLLALAKTDPANRTEAHGQVDLNYLAAEVTAGSVAAAASRRQELTFVGSDLPAVVQGDPDNLTELIANLVENAVSYTQAGGRVKVQIANGDRVNLMVHDNGPGIPEQERQHVFERFYRILGTGGPGSGLGLPIVKEIACAHHAGVSITDGPGGIGTTVCISFPASRTRQGNAG